MISSGLLLYVKVGPQRTEYVASSITFMNNKNNMTRIIKQHKASEIIEAEITRLSTFFLNSYFYELCWYSSVHLYSVTGRD